MVFLKNSDLLKSRAARDQEAAELSLPNSIIKKSLRRVTRPSRKTLQMKNWRICKKAREESRVSESKEYSPVR